MADTFATLIVTAADAPTARAIAASFGSGGAGMGTTPLSPTGSEPATHFISTGFIPADYVSLSPMTTWAQDETGAWVATDHYAGNAAAVAYYAGQGGVSVSEREVASVFANSDVSVQEPFTAMGRLGLQIVNMP